MDILLVAKLCYEANKAIYEANGDFSEATWENVPGWQQNSIIKGIIYVRDNPGITLAEQHDYWCEERTKQGWVYGPIKDGKKKTHPGLVPFEQLSFEQRVRDYVFCALVQACFD